MFLVSLHAVHVLEAPILCGFGEFSFSLFENYIGTPKLSYIFI
jgi:hypothetical protein